MKLRNRTIAIVVLLIMLASAFSMAALAETGKTWVVDDMDVINDSQLAELNEYAQDISETSNLDVAFLLATDTDTANGISLAEQAEDCYHNRLGLSSNGFILIIDEQSSLWNMVCFGSAGNIITEDVMDDLYSAYGAETTYVSGIRAYLEKAEGLLGSKATLYGNSVASDLARVTAGERLPRFIDDMGLLSAQDAAMLTARLDQVSEKHQFDVVVAVVSKLDYRIAHLYAADFFEQNGFGYGNELDGAILLLAVDDRDFGFASFGYGLYAFTPDGQEYLDKHFLPQLKEDKYAEAFVAFADAVDDFLTHAEAGKPYDNGNMPLMPSERSIYRRYAIIASILIALIAAAIVTGVWKGQLKSVRSQKHAHEYIRKDSMNLTIQDDIFMYRNVSRTRRVESSSSSGSSSRGGSFSSSSGRSSTGHSGKY